MKFVVVLLMYFASSKSTLCNGFKQQSVDKCMKIPFGCNETPDSKITKEQLFSKQF